MIRKGNDPIVNVIRLLVRLCVLRRESVSFLRTGYVGEGFDDYEHDIAYVAIHVNIDV